MSIRAAGVFSLTLGGLFASGDDPGTTKDEGWNQLYPTVHKFLGFMDVIGGRNNIAAGFAKVQLDATSKLRTGVDAHMFMPSKSGPYGVKDLIQYVEVQLSYELKESGPAALRIEDFRQARCAPCLDPTLHRQDFAIPHLL